VIEMTKPFRGTLWPAALLAVVLLAGGCGPGAQESASVTAPRGVGGAPAPPGAGAAAGARSPIKDIMGKLTKGPNSLTPVLGKALRAEPPAWEAIQAQTREFARLAADLGRHEPPKGSKESWAQRTSAYAESATALDRAAQAKDRDAALLAHGRLANSCMACHRDHRTMGPGMRGM
jgi:hypothetical protein